MSAVTLTLTSYNMGNVTEEDYDAWIAYVSERIDAATGLSVAVEAEPFGRGPDEDRVVGTDDERIVVHEALDILWESFCACNFGAEA